MTAEQKRPPAPFPLTIVTGFLGSGKTSLLNRLLREPSLADTLVIINEFGELGLDHLFVERLDGDLLVMTSGCLCCSIRGDLIATLENLLRRRDNARIAPFQRVMIETTGFADPAPVMHTVMAHPYLMLRFRLDSVITLVDAVNGMATLDAHEEAVKQAAMADRLVLSKTDLLARGGGAQELRARLKKLNPGAPVLDAFKGEAMAAALLDAGLYDAERKIPDVRRWLNAEAIEASAPHASDHTHVHQDGAGGHHHARHGVNRHGADIRTYCLRHEALLSPFTLDHFLETLRKAQGPKLLRVKGIVALSDDPSRPVVIHGVQHMFHPPLRLSVWPDGDHTTRIVFVLRGLEPVFVETLWQTVTGLVAASEEPFPSPHATLKDGFFS
ncbi:MAG: GTP-binding protein [Beijerinckiaceae bacterium]|nr:GTP-binding protein [Beijerinckiaceae bacterium]MCI0735317.1 GTP-binding protein [Beijerinckiaceae bacterium]